jgi:hypothetical protein
LLVNKNISIAFVVFLLLMKEELVSNDSPQCTLELFTHQPPLSNAISLFSYGGVIVNKWSVTTSFC